MDITLVPYSEIDGIRVFSDSEIASIFDRMEKDGTSGAVFYDRKIIDRAGFVVFMKHPDNFLYVIVDREGKKSPEQIGVVWLNNLRHKVADLHFCFFSNAWGERTQAAGKSVLNILINLKNGDGEFVFDAFYGIVPWWNSETIRLVKLCGGKPLCNIACACWNGVSKKNECGILFEYLREPIACGSETKTKS